MARFKPIFQSSYWYATEGLIKYTPWKGTLFRPLQPGWLVLKLGEGLYILQLSFVGEVNIRTTKAVISPSNESVDLIV